LVGDAADELLAHCSKRCGSIPAPTSWHGLGQNQLLAGRSWEPHFRSKTWIAAGIPENIVATLFSAESTRERIRQSKHFNTVARTATTAVAPKFCVFLDSLEESS
jgi:hypothetical protein